MNNRMLKSTTFNVLYHISKTNLIINQTSHSLNVLCRPMQDIRWVLSFIFGLLISHWALGMVATHQDDSGLYIAFVVLNIILGIAILMLRCFGDDQV